MQAPHPSLNLLLGWTWILLGFLSGMVLGLFFHREGWLGGYTSLRRRMYRLGHISFFGLGALNLLFHVTVRASIASTPALNVAAWAFAIGAVTMPLCCVVMAHWPRAYLIFSVPVLSLIAGGALTLFTLMQQAHVGGASVPASRQEVVAHPLHLSVADSMSARQEPRPTAIELSPQPSTDRVGPNPNPSRNHNLLNSSEIMIKSRITSRSRTRTLT